MPCAVKMPQLVEGLKLLNQADPSVEIIQQSTGEHILITAGELHLERCMKDLRERFAKISIEQSPPIVPFRETVTPVNGNDKNTATIATANKKLHMTVQAVPLPESLRVLLEKSAEQIKALQARPHDKEAATVFYDSLNDAFAEAGPEWKARFNLLWSFGPRRVGSNILINAIPGYGTDRYLGYLVLFSLSLSFLLAVRGSRRYPPSGPVKRPLSATRMAPIQVTRLPMRLLRTTRGHRLPAMTIP